MFPQCAHLIKFLFHFLSSQLSFLIFLLSAQQRVFTFFFHCPKLVSGSCLASLQNFSEFYEAFDITEEDAMWLPPEERVVIW